MMTMTESEWQLFYRPVEPTWIAHSRISAHGNCHGNPYAEYNDDTPSYRCNPYVQRNAVPNTVLAPSTQGLVYPNQARSCIHGGTAALAPVSTVYQQVAAIPSPAKQVQQSPGRLPGVLRRRDAVNVQTVHFMVPLCCGKYEDRVKEKLLYLGDVQRVTSDQWKQKVSVTSIVAPEKLLKRKSRRSRSTPPSGPNKSKPALLRCPQTTTRALTKRHTNSSMTRMHPVRYPTVTKQSTDLKIERLRLYIIEDALPALSPYHALSACV